MTVEFLGGLEGLKMVYLEWHARYMRLTEVGFQDMPLVNGMISKCTLSRDYAFYSTDFKEIAAEL